jgi:hypothetical protein
LSVNLRKILQVGGCVLKGHATQLGALQSSDEGLAFDFKKVNRKSRPCAQNFCNPADACEARQVPDSIGVGFLFFFFFAHQAPQKGDVWSRVVRRCRSRLRLSGCLFLQPWFNRAIAR